MTSMCNLLAHLELNRSLAASRCEHAEVRRLEQLIKFHREKCLTCSGFRDAPLEQQLFKRVVVVTDGRGAG